MFLLDGRMLRMFLAKVSISFAAVIYTVHVLTQPMGTLQALNCDPMRISKKFVGNSAIGKQVYKLQQTSIDEMTEAQHRKRCEVISMRFRLLAQPMLSSTGDATA